MSSITILIADDDGMTRSCLRRAVERDPQLSIGWEADNGLEALLLAQKHVPDVVLLNAQMPRMDGIEATRCLRQRRPQTRIVVMSAYDQIRSQALAAGADAFVVKDSGCEAIRDAIYQVVKPAPGVTN